MNHTPANMTAIERELLEWRNQHLRSYLESGGREGHVVDMSGVGGHRFTPALLLCTIGARSGEPRLSPLIYGCIDGNLVIVASKGGADNNPGWVQNIRAAHSVDVQVATQAWRAGWHEPVGAERARIWDFMVAVFPPYAEYQGRTQRLIPVFALTPREEIPVFGN